MNGTPRSTRHSTPNTALITTELAADEAGVTTATIRKWVQRGHLRSAGSQGRRHLFRLEDVFAAERTTYRARRPAGPNRPLA
ncbi:helix-turn-helix domain-containing protein [Streptomyces sp. BH-SS-21]|uniref:Helix-turn-helix domain-containing protein n=1 Tax=Streptomyces liliiviolaceus TaxID=2823109 RepID=A0A941B2F1_9ACTN|nr:helix-turn-helix domain-containing protein [Streptomyces liliiviolaceus]MBQ0848050.1 helix-turn-helix domain-containing protein [Streptomyces liliiviolaceus]